MRNGALVEIMALVPTSMEGHMLELQAATSGHFKRFAAIFSYRRTLGRNARLQPLLLRNQIEIECRRQVAYSPLKHQERRVNPNLTSTFPTYCNFHPIRPSLS